MGGRGLVVMVGERGREGERDFDIRLSFCMLHVYFDDWNLKGLFFNHCWLVY